LTWVGRIRRRALWLLVGIAAATLGMMSMTTLPAWPLVGVAVATAAIVLNAITRPLTRTSCLGCGTDLSDVPISTHGRMCRQCGMINERAVGDYPEA
jgi:hypothetical protein